MDTLLFQKLWMNKMNQTIAKIISIDPLDYNLNPSNFSSAPYQLEVYHTIQYPNKNVGVLNYNTGHASYKEGDIIDVTPQVIISQYKFLTNVVMNTFLKNYLRREKNR